MAAPLAPGDIVLGKYRVERVIGQGGMGVVLAARHTALGELFAIKLMLNVEGPAGRQAFDRFLREARICASLKGEHVVKVQDVGELEDGRPYMVMEYLEGQDLGSVIEKKGPLSLSNAAAVVLQACEALSEAHRLGIIHRDVKPPNMFLIRTPSGKVRLKLLDFGISKRVNAETKALTATGAMMGSPLYMSPEQLSDPRAVGPQTDIWAMGVVLYELVTGKVPFDGEMVFQVIQEILNKTPDLPSVHRPSLPVEVDKIVDKALRKDPAQRYASMDEFARDVRQLLQANSVIDSNFNLAQASDPEVTIDIEAATLNAISYGPTIEASSENLADSFNKAAVARASAEAAENAEPAQKTTTKSGAVVAAAVVEQSANRGANTHSDLTKSVVENRPAKPMSPALLGVGALALLAIGGGVVYALQGGGAASTPSAMVATPEARGSTAPVSSVPGAAPAAPSSAPAVPAASASAEAPIVAVGEAVPVAANAPSALAIGKTKPWPSSIAVKAAPTAPVPTVTTTATAKREGLF